MPPDLPSSATATRASRQPLELGQRQAQHGEQGVELGRRVQSELEGARQHVGRDARGRVVEAVADGKRAPACSAQGSEEEVRPVGKGRPGGSTGLSWLGEPRTRAPWVAAA